MLERSQVVLVVSHFTVNREVIGMGKTKGVAMSIKMSIKMTIKMTKPTKLNVVSHAW